jgi:lysophospholipase L1-like esterase
MKTRILRASVLFAFTTLMTSMAFAQGNKAQGHWVSAWSTAVMTPLVIPGRAATAPQSYENQTIRMVIRPSIGGDRLRVRFSNEFGTAPLVIGSAHIALVKQNGTIVAGSDRPLKFGGQASINISAGAPMLSDPVDLQVPAFTELAVSIYLPKASAPTTLHQLAQHETYISGPGDFTGAEVIPDAKTARSWFWLGGLEIWAGNKTSAIVALGDSITDGVGAKQGEYADWPDQLAMKLAEGKSSSSFSVTNMGIGANRILNEGAGASAIARFDRDVLAQAGVKDLIILEGINDIVRSRRMTPPPAPAAGNAPAPAANAFQMPTDPVTAQDLINGLQQMIDRAHEHGIRVFGATIMPYGATRMINDEGEAMRTAVNQWIRTSGAFDGVFDFDAAIRDPKEPIKEQDDLQSGDHVHPNAAGYKVLVGSMDISKLR